MKTVCSFDTREPLAHWHSVPEPSVSPPCEPPVWWLLYCLGALKSIIQCQWAVVSDKVMLALLCLCVNADTGNLILRCLWPHPTAWEHFVWSSVCIWGDGWLGRGHYAGFSGPWPECHDDVGMKQSQVCSVTEFHNFPPGGASVVAHVSAVQMAAIVTMYSTSWHAAQNVFVAWSSFGVHWTLLCDSTFRCSSVQKCCFGRKSGASFTTVELNQECCCRFTGIGML